MNEKGVIKFNCNWIKEEPLVFDLFGLMNHWRNILFSMGMIGANDDDVGYGNISTRYYQNQFIITGSATGRIKNLTHAHYTRVTEFSSENNTLTAIGPIISSSESLTHAALYESDKNIHAIMHVHHAGLWQHLFNKVPTSDAVIEYGTQGMADEIRRLYAATDLSTKKILVMGGHLEGIITFGNNLDDAGKVLLNYFNALK